MTKGNRKEKFYDEFMPSETKKIFTESSPAEEETTVPQTVKNGIIVNSLYVKVRKEPNFESEVLEVLRKGEVVELLSELPNFWKVSTKNLRVAYICSAFIQEE